MLSFNSVFKQPGVCAVKHCKMVGEIWKKILGEWFVLPVSYPAGVGWAIIQTACWCFLTSRKDYLGWLALPF